MSRPRTHHNRSLITRTYLDTTESPSILKLQKPRLLYT